MIGAMRGSATPTAAWAARAGLVSGPRKLNTVGTPSSRRGAPAWRNDGWNTGAKQKPMPASSTQAATPSGGRPMVTPSAARVETLKVPARSPPVPTTSTSGCSRSIGVALSSMARTRPVISVTVSPLIRRPAAKAAICAEVASPASTEPMAADASASVRSSRLRIRPSTPGQVKEVLFGSATAALRIGREFGAQSLLQRDLKRLRRLGLGAERPADLLQQRLAVDQQPLAAHRLELGQALDQRLVRGQHALGDGGRDGGVGGCVGEPAEGAAEAVGRAGELLEQHLTMAVGTAGLDAHEVASSIAGTTPRCSSTRRRATSARANGSIGRLTSASAPDQRASQSSWGRSSTTTTGQVVSGEALMSRVMPKAP